MKAFIVCFLALSVAFAAHETVQPSIGAGGLSLAEIKKYNELKETKWGKILIGLAEVHIQASGPIQRLIQALEDLIKELNTARSDENNRYESKRATHEANVQNINSQIGAANSEINSNRVKIQSILEPKKQQAQEDIARDTQIVAEKQENIRSATSNRNKDHADFEKRIAEHTEAIAAVDESLQLLGTLAKNKPSLLEFKKATMSFKKLELQIRKTHVAEIPFVEALISLAMNQDVNQDILNDIIQKLNKLRSRLASSVQLETENEAAAVKAFDELIVQLNKEINDSKNNIQRNTVLITETDKAIKESNNIIDKKTFEVEDLKAKLEAEQESWRQETTTHEEVIAEIDKEIDVVKQCKTLFESKQFSSYVNSRLGA
eukprot:TRINITY_DN0_c28_g1_i8.p1 TRINITY_DN0_c28_g1~~TRINITY_DN0_c28_g1_i8.p1  ORF type:complete len:376 (-),score=141.52 TRINITY_DN0_c28_g1_i8:126-1253(-)